MMNLITAVLESYFNVLNPVINALFKQKEKMNHNDVNALIRASICAHAIVRTGSWEDGDSTKIEEALIEELTKGGFDPQPVIDLIDRYFSQKKDGE